MKTFAKMAVAGLALTLGACTTCPDTGEYDRVPYAEERTAGSGFAVYDGKCPKPEPEPTPVVEPYVPPEPVTEAEPMFREQQRK